ncbi:MAG: tyrosine-type recombinase/integrase, partial [Verrucomicrobiota bacterium]
FDFIDWRRSPSRKGRYQAKLSTALLDLKLLGIIMQEAVERDLITGNPCLRLGIQREKPPEKPELTAEDCELIRKSIPDVTDPIVREMLANSFEIARYQGCRLSETRLNPQTDVTLPVGDAFGTIQFRAKGNRVHVTTLHTNLVPLFRRLKEEGKTTTWKLPESAGRQWASNKWWKFLDRIGLKEKGITFHGLRVTVATEMVRNNVPENKAMKYLGHASTTVNRIYQRLRPRDLGDCVDGIGGGRTYPASSPAATVRHVGAAGKRRKS